MRLVSRIKVSKLIIIQIQSGVKRFIIVFTLIKIFTYVRACAKIIVLENKMVIKKALRIRILHT